MISAENTESDLEPHGLRLHLRILYSHTQGRQETNGDEARTEMGCS